ncbi:MAG: aldo/keto reductase [Rhodospirillales bacterium]|nr:aldo/keto reductase [Rhodospirillales bacterium]
MERLAGAGISLPKLGLGTWKLAGETGRRAVESALALGYRHIDTAEMYGNEEAVGAAIAASGVPRSEIHLTTKVWWTNLAPAAIRRAIAASLERLRTDYADLYLIHWPAPEMDLAAALGAMLRLRDEGRVRAIGVANFPIALLRSAVEEIGAPIACNQVEYHVLLDQSKLLAYARAKQIPIIAYCPLAQGRLAGNTVLAAIAAKHGTTPAAVALAWLLGQEGVGAIPKSGRPQGQLANLTACDLVLDVADRAAIAALPKNGRCVSPSFAPLWD